MTQRYILGLVLSTLFLDISSADHLDEARVTFAIKAGWVEMTLRKDGAPVAGATMRIVDEKGREATGETGDDGEAAFPLPAGESCLVEIKIGDRLADPIRLYRTKDGVDPGRVLLSYGLRPCCRGRAKSEPVVIGAPSEPAVTFDVQPSPWRWLGIAFLTFVGIAMLGFWLQHHQRDR